jgi:hypothetical protein
MSGPNQAVSRSSRLFPVCFSGDRAAYPKLRKNAHHIHYIRCRFPSCVCVVGLLFLPCCLLSVLLCPVFCSLLFCVCCCVLSVFLLLVFLLSVSVSVFSFLCSSPVVFILSEKVGCCLVEGCCSVGSLVLCCSCGCCPLSSVWIDAFRTLVCRSKTLWLRAWVTLVFFAS